MGNQSGNGPLSAPGDILEKLWRRVRGRFSVQEMPKVALASTAAYALWAASYPPHAHNQIMALEQEAMLKLLPALAGRAVLDLACGTGRYSLIARKAGAAKVIGIDNSVPMLLAGIASTPNLRFAESSMTALPFAAGSFDIIICGLATGHLPLAAMQAALAEMGRLLSVGGEAFISDFHADLYKRGGRRTFTAPGGTDYQIEHYPYSLDVYQQAATEAGLTITGVEEPQADFRGVRVPAILAIRCQR